MARRFSRAGFIVLIVGTASIVARGARAGVSLPTNFVNEVLATGLNQPTSMAFLPDGRLLFTEQQTNRVRLFVNGHIASTDPVFTAPSVNDNGYERGLEGIAVDPAWPQRPFIYLYYPRIGGYCRLIRFKGSGAISNPVGENLTFSQGLPLIDDIPDLTPNHQAGCLRFGPDSMLYVSSGEDDRACPAADSTTLLGCIMRLDVRGLPDVNNITVTRAMLAPAGNPFPADSNSALVWAYGLRNPWRFQIDPADGAIYAADVGEDQVEELDRIERGEFLGWPWREGNVTIERSACPEPGGPGSAAYTRPIVAYERGPTMTAFISGGPYRMIPGATASWPPDYDGKVFYGEYYSGFLRCVQRVDTAWVASLPATGQPDTTNWATGLLSCVDFLEGPDGSLWWLRQYDDSQQGVTGSLQRIRWLGPASVGPAIHARTLAVRPNPSAHTTELSFRLAARAYVRLELYDATGRLVRRFVDATLPEGEHRFTWDGLDRSGHPVAPGVYLGRLERPGEREIAHVLRLR